MASADGRHVFVEERERRPSDGSPATSTDTDSWAGVPYEMLYRFSEFFIREEATGGGITIRTGGRIQLRYLTLVYNETAHFEVHVTPKNRKKRTRNSVHRAARRRQRERRRRDRPVRWRVPRARHEQRQGHGDRSHQNRSPFPCKLVSGAWTANYVNRNRSV